jgi:hypothetical protein
MQDPENQRPKVSKCSKYVSGSKWMGDPANNESARKKSFSPNPSVARKFRATFNLKFLARKTKAKTNPKFPIWNLKILD